MRRLSLIALLFAGCASAPRIEPTPELAAALSQADSLITAAIAQRQIPGAVLVVRYRGRIVHERAFGHAQLFDQAMQPLQPARPMTTATLFDLASVTKVMATTMAIMLLVDRGTIDLDAAVYTYLPEFRGPRHDSITVRHLLTHASGLHQWQPLYYNARNKHEALSLIRSLPLQWGVGSGRHYSDLGFMLLGYIVERLTGTTLDAFVSKELYQPLGLRRTGFVPASIGLSGFAATSHGNPYERKMVYDTAFGYDYDGDPRAWNGWREYTLVGEVNDGNAWYTHGGIAGHAGLFSTARELSTLMQLLLDGGTMHGRRFIDRTVIDTFTAPRWFQNGLGWAVPRAAPAGSFNHTGFTGTYILGVPSRDLAVVLLTNRQNLGVDADGNYSSITSVQNRILDLLVRSLQSR